MKTLSLVIPCLNEELAIPGVIDKCLKVKSKLLETGQLSDFQIIVVDDGSTDKSHELLKAMENQGQLRLIKNDSAIKGYGSALKKGLSCCSTDYLCCFDMDETYPPHELEAMLKKLESSGAEGVVGIRKHVQSGMPKVRGLGNSIYKNLINVLYPGKASDPCSGMWMIKQSTFKRWADILPNGLDFTLTLTLLMLKNKINFQEIPINYLEREGESKLSVVKDGVLFLNTILKHRP